MRVLTRMLGVSSVQKLGKRERKQAWWATQDVQNQGHMAQASHPSFLVHSQQLLHSARCECAISNRQYEYSINKKE